MASIEVIRSADLESALSSEPRQYLMGSLNRPQALEHIRDGDIEVGMVDYPEAAADDPHEHPSVHECQLVLEGHVLLLNLDTGEEIALRKGDFYSVPSNVPHVQKARKGTRVFFFKVPGMNDKNLVAVDSKVEEWLAELDF